MGNDTSHHLVHLICTLFQECTTFCFRVNNIIHVFLTNIWIWRMSEIFSKFFYWPIDFFTFFLRLSEPDLTQLSVVVGYPLSLQLYQVENTPSGQTIFYAIASIIIIFDGAKNVSLIFWARRLLNKPTQTLTRVLIHTRTRCIETRMIGQSWGFPWNPGAAALSNRSGIYV